MTESKKLDKPPIVEAILGIKLRDQLDISRLDDIKQNTFFSKYAISENVESFEANIKAKTINNKTLGYKLIKEDRSAAIFLEIDKLAISQLPPYESCEKLYNEYEKIWNVYQQSFDRIRISDIGLRNLNQFDIEEKRFQKYVNLTPQFHVCGLSTRPKSSFTKIDLVSEGNKATASVVFSVTPKENNIYTVIMDIDTHDSQVEYRDNKTIASTVEKLRKFKDEIFYSIIPEAENMQEFKI